MVIAIGNDHAGTSYKFEILKHLENKGIKVLNFGTDTSDSMDYADAIHPVANAVESGEATYGIIICGSGNGAQMTANKHQGIRAALCYTEDLARLTRAHNNANILCMGGRIIDSGLAVNIVNTFLNTGFDGGRHQRRIE